MDPDRLEVTTATPGPAFQPCLNGLLVVTEKDRQPLPAVYSCLCHVIFIETFFQKADVLVGRISFNAQAVSVHPCAPCAFPWSLLLPHATLHARRGQPDVLYPLLSVEEANHPSTRCR